VFAFGALLFATLPHAYRGGLRGRLAWLSAAAVVGGTLVALYFGPMKAQRDPNLFSDWRGHMPDYNDPAGLPFWLLKAVLGVFQAACDPSGFVLGLLAPLGVWGLWRAGRREVAVACVGLFALAIVAAGIQAYPFGQNRLSFYLTPAAIILGTAGVGELHRRRRRVGVGVAVLLVVVGDGPSLYHLVRPWLVPDAAAVHRYVQTHRQPGDVVLSDDAIPPTDEARPGNYLYFFFGELRPLAAGAEVPVGGRAWVVMDHYTAAERRTYIEKRLAPLGFELMEEKQYGEDKNQFYRSGVYLYIRR
jgi:hypothetical protein